MTQITLQVIITLVHRVSEKYYLQAGSLSNCSNGRKRDIRIKPFWMELNESRRNDFLPAPTVLEKLGTDMFGDYLPRATWCFEAIGAFGRSLWPFSFSGSGRRSNSSALPWKGIYREETVGT